MTETTARYLVATLRNHLRAHDLIPNWAHADAIASAIEGAAGPYLALSMPHGATAIAVARDLLSDDSLAYLFDAETPARDLVADWAVSVIECPDDEVWCIDGERVAYAVGKGYCWILSDGDDDGPTVIDIRPADAAAQIVATMAAIRREDDDLRGSLCSVCHTARPYRDIDGDGCLLDSASPYCPTCGAEYEEGTGYLERTNVCPHCQGDAVWVPAHGDAPGHDACILCHAVCDLDPTHGPTWGPPASEYLATWTTRPDHYTV